MNESASREKIKKVLKIVIPLVLVLLLIFIVLKVAFGDDHNIIFGKDGIESSRQVSATDTSKGVNGLMLTDQGMTVVAENDNLILSFSNREFVFDPG